MLYLYGEREITYIFADLDDDPQGIANRAYETYKKRPGFFTPYRNGTEFAGELLAPAIYPVAGVVTGAYSLFAAAVATSAFAGSLFVTLSMVCFGDTLGRDAVIEFARNTLYFAGVALITCAVALALAVISFPHSVISLFTRSAATVFVLATGDTDSYPAKDEELDSDEDSCCFSTL